MRDPAVRQIHVLFRCQCCRCPIAFDSRSFRSAVSCLRRSKAARARRTSSRISSSVCQSPSLRARFVMASRTIGSREGSSNRSYSARCCEASRHYATQSVAQNTARVIPRYRSRYHFAGGRGASSVHHDPPCEPSVGVRGLALLRPERKYSFPSYRLLSSYIAVIERAFAKQSI